MRIERYLAMLQEWQRLDSRANNYFKLTNSALAVKRDRKVAVYRLTLSSAYNIGLFMAVTEVCDRAQIGDPRQTTGDRLMSHISALKRGVA